MTQSRSPAYWAGNRYTDAEQAPAPTAPIDDLPPGPAERFQAMRTRLLAIQGVAESVRFMGVSWRWAWEYAIGNRKLCWLHVVRDHVSATFTLSELEVDKLDRGTRASGVIARAVQEGQRTGPVKWCWLQLDDKRTIDAFANLARRKAEWLLERPGPQRGGRPRGRRPPHGDASDAD